MICSSCMSIELCTVAFYALWGLVVRVHVDGVPHVRSQASHPLHEIDVFKCRIQVHVQGI